MRIIKDSELILTNKGHIYHIDLHPDEVANTIITVGDPGRVARVSQHFDTIEVKREKREFVTHTGYKNGKRITVISTGIGPDNIDIVINELDALVNVDLKTRQVKEQHQSLDIIRLGTSGCIQPGVPTGSLLLSSFGLGMDNLIHFYEYTPQGEAQELTKALLDFDFPFPTRPYVVKGSDKLMNQLGEGVLKGITVTAPGFYAPQGRELRLNSRYGSGKLDELADFAWNDWQITNFEMETSAIYGLANLLGHEAMSCSVILANRADKTMCDNPGQVVDDMIVQMLDRIC